MSNDNGRIRTYKNKDRNRPENVRNYVPQYQLMGVEPQEYKGAAQPANVKVARVQPLPSDNPRGRRVGIRQPYAAVTPSPVGAGRGPVPNVGNNMEHMWSSVDGEIVDDLGEGVDPNQPMVDNNEFVTDEALGFQNGITASDIQENPYQGKVLTMTDPEVVNKPLPEEDLLGIVANLEEDTFLLIVSGVPVCSGPMAEIEDQARALVFGEHEMCDGNPIPVDDIIILKRVKVKVGLFLE